MRYFWSIFTMLLTYVSAIFYQIDSFPDRIQKIFYINPIYLYIRYFRKIVISGEIPQLSYHLLMLAEAVLVFSLGAFMYRKYNMKFLYYV